MFLYEDPVVGCHLFVEMWKSRIGNGAAYGREKSGVMFATELPITIWNLSLTDVQKGGICDMFYGMPAAPL